MFQHFYVCLLRFKVKTLMFRFREEVEQQVEILKVKAEENRMVSNWTNTVLNINKRDEALINFKEGVEARKIELKEVKAKIEGRKNDILGRQAEHEQLTGIFKWATKLARENQGTIKRLERQTAERL